jgi:hypothetical protein
MQTVKEKQNIKVNNTGEIILNLHIGVFEDLQIMLFVLLRLIYRSYKQLLLFCHIW